MEAREEQNGKASGFTLIELLVVIAVISLLMAISLPVLHRVRKQARGVTCQARLRQFGVIMAAYAADHDARFDLSDYNPESLYDPLRKYAADTNDLLLCPSAREPALQAFTPYGGLGTTFKAWASALDPATVYWKGS